MMRYNQTDTMKAGVFREYRRSVTGDGKRQYWVLINVVWSNPGENHMRILHVHASEKRRVQHRLRQSIAVRRTCAAPDGARPLQWPPFHTPSSAPPPIIA